MVSGLARAIWGCCAPRLMTSVAAETAITATAARVLIMRQILVQISTRSGRHRSQLGRLSRVEYLGLNHFRRFLIVVLVPFAVTVLLRAQSGSLSSTFTNWIDH